MKLKLFLSEPCWQSQHHFLHVVSLFHQIKIFIWRNCFLVDFTNIITTITLLLEFIIIVGLSKVIATIFWSHFLCLLLILLVSLLLLFLFNTRRLSIYHIIIFLGFSVYWLVFIQTGGLIIINSMIYFHFKRDLEYLYDIVLLIFSLCNWMLIFYLLPQNIQDFLWKDVSQRFFLAEILQIFEIAPLFHLWVWGSLLYARNCWINKFIWTEYFCFYFQQLLTNFINRSPWILNEVLHGGN